MKPPSFDEFIAIDWSGAAGRYDGIAVATCTTGVDAPVLVRSQSKRWTRTEIADWLTTKLRSRKRCFIGLDFAFGFPFEPCGYLGGATAVDEIFDLWELIDKRSAADRDFGCASFVHHPDYSHLFWIRSRRPERWVNRKRQTEYACAKETGTHPDTVFKLIGPKQVGKASITGIRVLHDVRSRTVVSVWPFAPVRSSVFVEIYPTLFRMQATGNTGKIRSWPDLNGALTHFGSRPIRARTREAPTDHETDALLTAAALRACVRNSDLWLTSGIASDQVRREGWIFGVRVV